MYSVEVLDADFRHLVAPAHGLDPGVHWLITFLDATDGSTRWMPRRAYHPEATRSIYLPEASAGSDFGLSPDAKRAHAGPVERRSGPDSLTVRAPDGSSHLAATASTLRWTESDLLDVSGNAVGPACRLRMDDPAFPLLYTTRPYRVTGSVQGVPADGAVLLVTVHLREGAELLTSPLLRRLQIVWTEFVNIGAGGQVESGLLIWGREGLAGMAVSRSDGSAFATSDIDVTIENDGGDPEFARRIVFRGAGETLTWDALPRGGRWPARDDIPDGYRFRQGTVHREGAGAPALSYAFAETFQDRM